jgi:hypothetical protein
MFVLDVFTCPFPAKSIHHSGNKNYRDVVQRHEAAYNSADVAVKAGIENKVIDEIRRRNPLGHGRFLAHDPRLGLWYEVQDVSRVRAKVKQSFKTNSKRREKEEKARLSAPAQVRACTAKRQCGRASVLAAESWLVLTSCLLLSQQGVTYVEPNEGLDFLIGKGGESRVRDKNNLESSPCRHYVAHSCETLSSSTTVYTNKPNVQLRELVQARKETYHKCANDADKNSMIHDVVEEWRRITTDERRFLGRFPKGCPWWSEASEPQVHRVVQRMFLRPATCPKGLSTGCRTPTRHRTSALRSDRALVTPSPFKEPPQLAQAGAASFESLASDYKASTPSDEASFDVLVNVNRRVETTNSGRKPPKPIAKRDKSQGEPEWHPHEHEPIFDAYHQGLDILNELTDSDMARAAGEALQGPLEDNGDSHLTVGSIQGTDSWDPGFLESHSVGGEAHRSNDMLIDDQLSSLLLDETSTGMSSLEPVSFRK